MKNLIKNILREGEDDGWDWAREIPAHPFSNIVEVLNPVPDKDKPKNMFIIYSEWMHGDADAYTKEEDSFDMSDTNDRNIFEEQVKAYNLGINSDWNEWNDIRDGLRAIGIEDGVDMWIGDATADHQYPARLTDFKIRYFDGVGTEYGVRVL